MNVNAYVVWVVCLLSLGGFPPVDRRKHGRIDVWSSSTVSFFRRRSSISSSCGILLMMASIIHLPFVGILIGSTAVSLFLNVRDRDVPNPVFARLSARLMEMAMPSRAAVLVFGVLPLPVLWVVYGQWFIHSTVNTMGLASRGRGDRHRGAHSALRLPVDALDRGRQLAPDPRARRGGARRAPSRDVRPLRKRDEVLRPREVVPSPPRGADAHVVADHLAVPSLPVALARDDRRGDSLLFLPMAGERGESGRRGGAIRQERRRGAGDDGVRSLSRSSVSSIC